MIQFNNTTNGDGLVQYFEQEIGANPGDVSGNTTKLKWFTSRVNRALDRYFAIAIQASGTWELDDSNHSSSVGEDYNVIYSPMSSGQSDYSFFVDGGGNAILDIYKVLILPTDTATVYQEVYPVDETSPEGLSIVNESNITGVPTKYSKRGNAIQFDKIPDYTVARGIKILINRESSYYEYTDTTKTPGYPYHQEYFYLKPAYDDARINSKSTLNYLANEVLKLEGDNLTGKVGLISKAYGNRQKDIVQNISGECINSI